LTTADNTRSANAQADGETLLLVGASADIGRALLKRLDGERLTVLATYHDSGAKLAAMAGKLRTLKLIPLHVDLAEPDAVAALIATIKSDCPRPTRIVHLAAPKLRMIRFRDTSWDDFQTELDVQLRSIVAILREFLPQMAQNKKGKVVFVLSSATWGVPPVAMSHYVATKYALRGLMKALAAEYSKQGLNINAVSPSMMETAFLEKLPPRSVEIAAAQSPRGRHVTADEIAGVVTFLLSPDADYMTGTEIPVAGGTVF
jgi:3-oxoacyl-[acyl-carrier protein] reductase